MMYQTPGLEKQQDGAKSRRDTKKNTTAFGPILSWYLVRRFLFPHFQRPHPSRFMPHSESNFVDIYLQNMALHSPQQHNSRNKRNKL